MAQRPPILLGNVYWLAGCPPLDGSETSRRPVVVIDDEESLASGCTPVIVFGITTTDCIDHDKVDLPHWDIPGLSKPCCALPRWIISVDRTELVDYIGRLPQVTIVRLVEAVSARWDAGDTPSATDPGRS